MSLAVSLVDLLLSAGCLALCGHRKVCKVCILTSLVFAPYPLLIVATKNIPRWLIRVRVRQPLLLNLRTSAVVDRLRLIISHIVIL